MPKLNIGDLLKKSFEAIDNLQNEARPPVETDKNVGGSKKGKKREKKARSVIKKGEKKTKEMKAKAKAKADKKNKGKDKPKAESEPFYEKSWHLDKDKKVTLKKLNGQVLVDVREFYMDKLSQEMMPGKKGISLTMEQIKEFKSLYKVLDDSFPTFDSERDFYDPLA